MVGACLQVYICLQSAHVHHIRQFAIGAKLECRWQVYLQSREGRLLHISPKSACYVQWIIRPLTLHWLRQGIADKEEEV